MPSNKRIDSSPSFSSVSKQLEFAIGCLYIIPFNHNSRGIQNHETRYLDKAGENSRRQ